MKISVGKTGDLTTFKEISVNKSKLLDIVVTRPYSLSTFKNNYRNIENFKQADLIALDIDEKITIEQAKELFKEYTYIIAPSRNHNKIKVKKSGVELPACERFRIIFPLKKPITDIKTFYATWFFLNSICPEADEQCKDPSRFYYASKEILCVHKGKLLKPVKPTIEIKKPEQKQEVKQEQDGILSKRTLKFLLLGARIGTRHGAIQRAAIDAHEQGYSKEWFIARINELVERTGDEAFRDKGALKTIDDMFNKQPRYDKRKEKSTIRITKFSEMDKSKTEMDWFVDGLFHTNGVGLIAARPKTGKSTLVRQLTCATLMNQEFLKRKVKQGKVLYLSIEESEETINSNFKKLGIPDNAELYIHVGKIDGKYKFESLVELISQLKPILVVIDTLGKFIDADMNSYNEIQKALENITAIARDNACHICLIHHTNKPYQGNNFTGASAVLGSQAITGGVDSYVLVERDGNKRYVTSEGRGIVPWFQIEIDYHSDREIYTLGKQRKEDDDDEY